VIGVHEESVDVPVRFQIGEPDRLPVRLGDDREPLGERGPSGGIDLVGCPRANLFVRVIPDVD